MTYFLCYKINKMKSLIAFLILFSLSPVAEDDYENLVGKAIICEEGDIYDEYVLQIFIFLDNKISYDFKSIWSGYNKDTKEMDYVQTYSCEDKSAYCTWYSTDDDFISFRIQDETTCDGKGTIFDPNRKEDEYCYNEHVLNRKNLKMAFQTLYNFGGTAGSYPKRLAEDDFNFQCKVSIDTKETNVYYNNILKKIKKIPKKKEKDPREGNKI